MSADYRSHSWFSLFRAVFHPPAGAGCSAVLFSASVIFSLVVGPGVAAEAADKAAEHAMPPGNPHLADSSYPVTHYRANRTTIAGPVGPGRRLGQEDWTWVPTGPINAYPPTYSGTYLDGRRVIWISGNDRIAKLDAETLE
ncbi:MAG: hypothetical protein ACK5HY_10570, partial [Parahaliea sp.]